MRRHAPPRGVLVTTALQLHKTRPGGIRAAVSLLLLIPILVPLFAAALSAAEEAAPDPLREALSTVDADSLSAREALDLVYRLKALADGAGDH